MKKYRTFGEIIEERLNILNISQRKLAEASCVDVSYINKIIKNKTQNPSYTTVVKIANVLNISNMELEDIFNSNFENAEFSTSKNEESLTFEEKSKIDEIMDNLINDDMLELKKLNTVIGKIGELQELRQKYYVVNKIDDEQTFILVLKALDKEFLNLYGSFIKSYDFLIVRNIEQIPSYARVITLSDLLELLSDFEYDEDALDLIEYIKNYM